MDINQKVVSRLDVLFLPYISLSLEFPPLLFYGLGSVCFADVAEGFFLVRYWLLVGF